MTPTLKEQILKAADSSDSDFTNKNWFFADEIELLYFAKKLLTIGFEKGREEIPLKFERFFEDNRHKTIIIPAKNVYLSIDVLLKELE
jgi:hypothetical protein